MKNVLRVLKSRWWKKETYDVFILLAGDRKSYVSYDPVSETYRVIQSIGQLKVWDWQLYEDVFSDYEKDRFFLRRVTLSEFETLDKKYNLLELLKK
ncbi:hypothetical protein [Ekhidna sp.]